MIKIGKKKVQSHALCIIDMNVRITLIRVKLDDITWWDTIIITTPLPSSPLPPPSSSSPLRLHPQTVIATIINISPLATPSTCHHHHHHHYHCPWDTIKHHSNDFFVRTLNLIPKLANTEKRRKKSLISIQVYKISLIPSHLPHHLLTFLECLKSRTLDSLPSNMDWVERGSRTITTTLCGLCNLLCLNHHKLNNVATWIRYVLKMLLLLWWLHLKGGEGIEEEGMLIRWTTKLLSS